MRFANIHSLDCDLSVKPQRTKVLGLRKNYLILLITKWGKGFFLKKCKKLTTNLSKYQIDFDQKKNICFSSPDQSSIQEETKGNLRPLRVGEVGETNRYPQGKIE